MTVTVFNPEKVDETPQYALGELGVQRNGDEYIYVGTKNRCRAERGARIGRDRFARLSGAAAGQGGHKFGVPDVEIPNGQFGWVKWTGEATCRAGAAVANAGTPLNATSNGNVTGGSVTGGGLEGCYNGSAALVNGQPGTIELYRAVYNNGST